MKMRKPIVGTLCLMIFIATADGKSKQARSGLEEHIRMLEEEQITLLLHNDIAKMRRNWASDYVVNNPFNAAVDAKSGPIAAGTLTYSRFDRNIERVLLRGNTVIVMGSETVVPSGTSQDAG